ncbi:DUF3365 domain-containing protein [bacterium]|nr:DUF3365 domain-containing protein [bacterium]
MKKQWKFLLLANIVCSLALGQSPLFTSQAQAKDAMVKESSYQKLAFELTALFRAYRATITKNKKAIHKPNKFFTKKNIDKRVKIMHTQAKILYKLATKKKVNQDYMSPEGKIRKKLELAFEMVLREYAKGNVDLNWRGKNKYISKWDGKFLPARWAAIAATNFEKLTEGKVIIKLTTSNQLLVNKSNAPDAWESKVIDGKLLHTSKKRPGDSQFKDEKTQFRFLLPEYYKPGCIGCHGTTKKSQEGYAIHPSRIQRKVFDFAGAISVRISK